LLAGMASALLNSHGYQDLLTPNTAMLCFNGAIYQGSRHIPWDWDIGYLPSYMFD
jgi:hypothetical protein